MKYSVISYKDKELETFSPVILIPNDVESCREMIREAAVKGKIEDCENKIAYFLGEFDTQDATFNLLVNKELLMDLSQFVKIKKDA